MASFGFTEEHEMLRRMVQDFARKELAPGAKKRAEQTSIPPEILRRTGELGLLAPHLSSKYGGQEGDLISLGIVVEEIAKADINLSLVLVNLHGAELVLQFSSEDMREEWLPPLARGEQVACFCVTEPEAGSDVANMSMRAIRGGDSYFLTGEKTSISLGMQSDIACVFAKTDPTAGARGVTCFWVPLNLPGIEKSLSPDMGLLPLGRASIIMDEVRIPIRYRIGEEGEGFYKVMSCFDNFRPLLALMALGSAQASLEQAISYAKERIAFGRPIAKFEGVSFKIAEAATEIEAARLLCYQALWLGDQGIRHVKESAMCKWFSPQVALRVAHNALLIHGHLGYSADLPLEQRLRDIIGIELADGTAEIMKLIISREIMGREFLPYR